MVTRVRTSAVEAARDTVPFLVITAIWIVVMLVIYGLFLISIPADVSYGPAVHASVFVPALVGFISHSLHQVLKTKD